MLRIITIFAAMIAAGAATAAPRRWEYTAPDRGQSQAMNCATAQAYVASRGAALVTTMGRDFDRYVRDGSYCYPITQEAKPAFAPTRDNIACHIGYTCEDRGLGYED